MSKLLNAVTSINTNGTTVTQGNMKLQITVSDGTVLFYWMYTQDGIDYQTKGLQMTFQNDILTTMTDGYFLYTVGSTDLAVSQSQAVTIAQNYVKTLSYTIGGQQINGFATVLPPLSVQLVPHTRGNSVGLIPYWYVELSLAQTYTGGYNIVTVGIYADTGEVADFQVLASSPT